MRPMPRVGLAARMRVREKVGRGGGEGGIVEVEDEVGSAEVEVEAIGVEVGSVGAAELGSGDIEYS